jgi:hypothetical protein
MINVTQLNYFIWRFFLLFLIFLSPWAVSLYPSSSPLATPGSNGQGFGTQVTQNTQSALKIFTGVNAAAFLDLKDDDSDFQGFGGDADSSGPQKFSVDLKDQPLEQSDLDTQIEGDWNDD